MSVQGPFNMNTKEGRRAIAIDKLRHTYDSYCREGNDDDEDEYTRFDDAVEKALQDLEDRFCDTRSRMEILEAERVLLNKIGELESNYELLRTKVRYTAKLEIENETLKRLSAMQQNT